VVSVQVVISDAKTGVDCISTAQLELREYHRNLNPIQTVQLMNTSYRPQTTGH